MKRRLFLKQTSSALLLSSLPLSLFAQGAYTSTCNFTDHLLGEIPSDASLALSSTGQFHHYHYLHIPQIILDDPPAAGWSTITSLMMPHLGIHDFFFRMNQYHKQFHCHQVWMSQNQLQSIANGEEVQVTAYIFNSSKQAADANHTFVFNPQEQQNGQQVVRSQADLEQEIIDIANSNNRVKIYSDVSDCDSALHGGVTVFNSRGERTYNNIQDLEELKGY